MQVSSRQNDLNYCLNVVEKGVSSRSTLPILNGILLDAENQRLRFVSSNLELSIQAVLEHVEITGESKIVLPAKFVDVVRQLSNDTVNITVDNEKLHAVINSGKAVFNLYGMDGNDFPNFTKEEEWKEWSSIEISAVDLKEIIKKIIFAVSHDEGRPLFRSILINFEENGDLTAVATDTYRLARLQRSFDEHKEIEPLTLLVPGRTLNEIIKVIESVPDESIKCYFKEKEIIFCYRQFAFSSRLVEGKFPEVSGVFPQGFKTKVSINKTLLANLLHRAILLAHGQNQMIMLQINGDQLHVRSSSDSGNMDEELELNFKEGEDLENILLNARFMLDPIRVIEDENVLIEFNGPLGPCIFKSEEEKEGIKEKYEYLVLPIKTEKHT